MERVTFLDKAVREVKTNARIHKLFCASPSIFQDALPKFTRVFKVFLWFKRQSDKISILLTGETFLKTPLVFSVVLENSRGERAQRF